MGLAINGEPIGIKGINGIDGIENPTCLILGGLHEIRLTLETCISSCVFVTLEEDNRNSIIFL